LKDVSNGRGRLIHKDGHIYDGNWVNASASGHGILYNNDGSVYTGNWENDL